MGRLRKTEINESKVVQSRSLKSQSTPRWVMERAPLPAPASWPERLLSVCCLLAGAAGLAHRTRRVSALQRGVGVASELVLCPRASPRLTPLRALSLLPCLLGGGRSHWTRPAPQQRPWSQTAWVGLGVVCPAPSPGKWGCYDYGNWYLQGTRTGLGTCNTHSSSFFTQQIFEHLRCQVLF